MPLLIANDGFLYAGKSLKPGDTFEASDGDARLLKFVGKAADAPSPKPTMESRALKAMDEAADDETQEEGRKRRRYRRADMRVED